jgi:hypothetical protein
MKPGETLLEMARRHVREGEGHVREQRGIVARLSEDSLVAEVARQLLTEFEQGLDDHRASLERIEAEIWLGHRDPGGELIEGETGGFRPTAPRRRRAAGRRRRP